MENLENLSNLRILNLSNNQIQKLEIPSELKKLEELNLRKNHISELNDLSHIGHCLLRVYLSSNCIESLDCVGSLPNLRELTLDNNPIADKEDVADFTRSMLVKFPSLIFLNLQKVAALAQTLQSNPPPTATLKSSSNLGENLAQRNGIGTPSQQSLNI